jgi:hypothetical protein
MKELAFPGDEIGQRKLLNQRGPTSNQNSRFFMDSTDFSRVQHPSDRILYKSHEIRAVQTKCQELLLQKGTIGYVENLAKAAGLKPAVV